MASSPPRIPNTLPFKWVFLAVVSLMVAFFCGSIYLAGVDQPTQAQTKLVEFFSDAMKMCLGAILGLLGGRATDVRANS